MIDLRAVREATKVTQGEKVVSGITQADIAKHLGITQGQVSKYEATPGQLSLELMDKWVQFLGHDMPTALKFFGKKEESTPLDPEEDYSDFQAKKQLLLAYLEAGPIPCPDKTPEENTPQYIRSKIERGAKLPNLVFAGMFDSAKSRMINELLGMSIVPEGYQPETQINHIILHSSEKPEGMAEDVVILKAGLDFGRRSERDHLMTNRVIMGGHEILREYGSHKGDKKEGDTALVFANSPLLKVCNIIDTPGDLNDEDDTSTASKAIASADVVVITSSVTAFLSGPEIGFIDNIIRRLPAPDANDPEFPTLGNLFIVATHAVPSISEEKLQNEILRGGCERLWRLMGDYALAERAENTARNINQSTLQKRFFPFYAESPKRRKQLESELVEILGRAFPKTVDLRMFKLVEEIKKETGNYYSRQIEYFHQAIENREAAKAKLKKLREGDPEFKKKLDEKEKKVLSLITDKKREMSIFIDSVYEKTVVAENIEKVIRHEYGKDKKKAQEFIAQNVMGELHKPINRKAREDSEEVTALVDEYLSSFNTPNECEGVGVDSSEIPFNAKGAFLGGLVGVAGVGALALWASTLGNLGAYIIAAKGASLLAALGISFGGGAATVTGGLAAIGGPVTIAIGVVVATVLLGWALFGESWQRRLAKNVVRQFDKEGVSNALKENLGEFWDQTRKGFEKGAEKVREKYDEHIAELDAKINDPQFTIEKMTKLVDTLKRVRDFLANMPWKAERTQ